MDFTFVEKFSKSMLKRNKGLSLMINLSSQTKQDILTNYINIKNKYSIGLISNMNQFMNGKMNKDEYLKMQKTLIRNTFTGAFTLGKYFGTGNISTMASDEKNFLTYQITNEMKFMENFANDIVNNSGTMPYRRRMKMYSDSLDSMFGFGRLVYLPEDVQIYWKLGVTDKHCIDCLMFASQNPYTKKTLPGFPKSGNSVCLSNCLCRLIYIHPTNRTIEDYDSYIVSNFKKGKAIPNEEEYRVIMGYYDEYYFNRIMYEITKDKSFFKSSKDALSSLSNYQRVNNFSTSSLPIATLLNDVKQIQKVETFSFVENITDSKVGDFVAFFVKNEFKYGKVSQVLSNAIQVSTLENITFDLQAGKTVLFKES